MSTKVSPKRSEVNTLASVKTKASEASCASHTLSAAFFSLSGTSLCHRAPVQSKYCWLSHCLCEPSRYIGESAKNKMQMQLHNVLCSIPDSLVGGWGKGWEGDGEWECSKMEMSGGGYREEAI